MGIGETLPDALLHLKKSSGNAELKIEAVSAGDPVIKFVSANNRTGDLLYTDATTLARFSYDHAAVAFKMYAHNQASIDFYVSETEAYFPQQSVGIGLTSPAAKLHVSGTSTQLMLETPNSTNDIDFRWRENGTNKWNIRYQNATEDLQILNQIGPTIVQMHFESSNARVGIGNVNPTGRLTVEDESGNQLHLRNGNTASGRYWNFDVASDSKLYVINQQGTGVYIAHGATSWTGTSDESLKENIKPLENVLDKIKDYRCVEYNLKSVPDDKKIGFIAQDWKNDFAPIVDEDNDGLLGMKYTETIPVLLKAIQELKAEIEILKNK